MGKYDQKYTGKTIKMINFVKKTINFDFFCKKISPSGGPPLGKLLKRRAGLRRPAAPGLKCVKNTRKSIPDLTFFYSTQIGF